jgi:hypothetical protein
MQAIALIDCSLPDLPPFASVARYCTLLVALWIAVTEPSVEANRLAHMLLTLTP